MTVRNGKTGYRVANTMSGAVSAYERIKARYPDAGGEDYLFLPDYPNRATASRIFQRQFNQLMEKYSCCKARRIEENVKESCAHRSSGSGHTWVVG